MIVRAALSLSAALLLPATVLAQGAGSNAGQSPPAAATQKTVSPGAPVTTATFLEKVAAGNTFEIDSSRLATSKSANDTVKAFAQQMVSDHTEAGSKFKAAVSESGLKAPADKLDAKHAAIVEKLKGLQGAEFDRAYLAAQREAHVETIALFEAYAARGDNDRMKKFATDMLPVLRSHLDRLKAIKG